ncbi:hypothetical protein COV20_05095 [Candidatus Woesearchaeota archaeon CG10_big_fil_rev_8_21_14_0_10_45_16]|nr:MAG: hypothetical protein COV20_05095 [Candidatus Woesearchaeota archaeon CG10_big_fil_rev_8_21_14_0_10_45_16]
MKKLFWALVLVVILVAAWYLISPAFQTIELDEQLPIETDEAMPSQLSVLSEGLFQAGAHEVEGKALLIETASGRVIRLEDFDTINGPDLHIYLSADLESQDYIDLGPIKATKGNVNYEVPAEVDTAKYNKVLVWCVPFKVLFSYVELEERS